MKYASFEISQNEILRARNVFERALNIHFKEISIWLKYAEMELQCKQVQHARNLYQRSLCILPRANQLWYKYVYMEEKLKNIEAARRIFKRWMAWTPPEQAWHSFINMEKKYGEIANAHNIYKVFVQVHPDEKNWIKWAKFEETNYRPEIARNVFTSAVHFYGSDNPPPNVLKEFAKFEERQAEHDRVKAIYKYALDNLPTALSADIYRSYHEYEKKFGDQLSIQESIVIKRRHHYETRLAEDAHDYDEWFGYLRMMEEEAGGQNGGQADDDGGLQVGQPGWQAAVREIYERAIACKPLIEKKSYWRRYVHLWIRYALFEELSCDSRERAVAVYAKCLEHIPHRRFTFAKIWILKAELHVRQRDLPAARLTLGNALGRCGKTRLYRFYIDLETQLLEFERVRQLYKRFVVFRPANQHAWIEFAQFECRLRQFERVRAIYESALRTDLERPYFLWKSYVDFEASLHEFERCWSIHRRMLELEEHALIWCSFASLQLLDFDETDEASIDAVMEKARGVFVEANDSLRKLDGTQRELLLKCWKRFEEEYGTSESVGAVERRMPRRVVQRSRVDNEEAGVPTWVETTILEFPDDGESDRNMSVIDDFLRNAEDWGTSG